jgi:hypothetical protein
MGKGGRREGAGRKPTWQSGTTKAIKIPLGLVDNVMRYARQLDAGNAPLITEPNSNPAPDGDRWQQVKGLVEEKQELTKQLQHLQDQLTKERKARDKHEQRIATLESQVRDARSILHSAIDEKKKGVRSGISVKDVKSALMALGDLATLNE